MASPVNPVIKEPIKVPTGRFLEGDLELSALRIGLLVLVKVVAERAEELSIAKSAWAKAYYQMMLSRKKKPQMAKRALAFKWQRIIFRCWQDGVPYDESRYIARLREKNSPLLAFMDTK